MIYTDSDVGCYGDGALGHEHIREKLALLICGLGLPTTLVSELRAPMSDDAGEEDEALELLNARCAENVYFEFVDGDLMLVKS